MADVRIVSGYPVWLRLFGLPFALIGGWGVYGLLSGRFPVTVDDRAGTAADAWMPGLFLVVGLVLTCIRYRRVVDPARRTIERRRGWLLWTRTTRFQVGDWRRIEVRPAEERGTGSGRHAAIPVAIVGDDGSHEVEAPRDAVRAAILAQRLAGATGLPLHDTGRGTVLAGGAAGALLPRLGPRDGEAPEPQRNRLRCEELVGGYRIRIPPSSGIGSGAVALATWAALAIAAFGRAAPVAASLAIAVPGAALIAAALASGALGYAVAVDPRDGLRIGRVRIAPEALRRLEPLGGGLYIASTDRGILVGRGLRDDELRWLRARIVRALRG